MGRPTTAFGRPNAVVGPALLGRPLFHALVMSSPFILYLHPIPDLIVYSTTEADDVDNAVGEFLKGGCMMAIVYPVSDCQ